MSETRGPTESDPDEPCAKRMKSEEIKDKGPPAAPSCNDATWYAHFVSCSFHHLSILYWDAQVFTPCNHPWEWLIPDLLLG